MFSSILSTRKIIREQPKQNENQRWIPTEHAALLIHQRPKVTEDLVQLMDTCFNFSDLSLPFLDEGLLISQFMRRKLSLQNLSLSLFLRSR